MPVPGAETISVSSSGNRAKARCNNPYVAGAPSVDMKSIFQNQCIIVATRDRLLSAGLVLHFHPYSLRWVDLLVLRLGERKTYPPLHNFEAFLLRSPSEP